MEEYMLAEIMLAGVALIVLAGASYADLKTREIPDWLSYGLLFSAVGLRVIFSLKLGWSYLWAGLLGFIILFLVGYVLYLISQWGGGDAKLLMGMGAIIGFSLPFGEASFQVFWYFILLLVVGAVYGILWIIWLTILHRKKVIPLFKAKVMRYRFIHYLMMGLTVALMILTSLNSLFLPLLFFPLPIFYLFIAVSVVEEACFYRRVHARKLTEGDWLAEDIRSKGRIVLEKKTLDKDDIQKLRDKGLSVLIKEGIPFIPSFLLAYVLFLLSGNLWESLRFM